MQEKLTGIAGSAFSNEQRQQYLDEQNKKIDEEIAQYFDFDNVVPDQAENLKKTSFWKRLFGEGESQSNN